MRTLPLAPPRATGERISFERLFQLVQDAGVSLVTDDPTGLLDASLLTARTPRSSLDRFARLLERQRDGDKLLAFIEGEQRPVPGSSVPLTSLRSGFSHRLRTFLEDLAGQSPATPPARRPSAPRTSPLQSLLPSPKHTPHASAKPAPTPPPSRSRRRHESQPIFAQAQPLPHGRARTSIPKDLPSSLSTTVSSQMSIDESIAVDTVDDDSEVDDVDDDSREFKRASSIIDVDEYVRESSPVFVKETYMGKTSYNDAAYETDGESAFSPTSSEREDSPTPRRRPLTRHMAPLTGSTTTPSRQTRRRSSDNSSWSASSSFSPLPSKRGNSDDDDADEYDDDVRTINSRSFDFPTFGRSPVSPSITSSPKKQRKVAVEIPRSRSQALSRPPPSSRPRRTSRPPPFNISPSSRPSADARPLPQPSEPSSSASTSPSLESSPSSATPPISSKGAAARRAAIMAAFDVTPSTPPNGRVARTGATRELNELALGSASKPVAPAPSKPTTVEPWRPSKPLQALPSSQAFLPIVPPNLHQALLNNRVVYGVQWELERQLAAHSIVEWDDLTEDDICQLGGPARVAIPKLAPLLKYVVKRKAGFDEGIRLSPERGLSAPSANPTTAEMDAEEDLIRKGNEALKGFDKDNRLWNYGGRLVYSVNVVFDPPGVRTIPVGPTPVATRWADPFSDDPRPIDTPDNPMGPSAADAQTVGFPFRFQLRAVEPPTKSTHLARRFGSRRVLTLRIRDLGRDVRPQLFQMLLGRGLVLFGRVFRVLWVPPEAETAIAIQTDEVAPGLPNLPYEPLMPSFTELIARYNSLEAKRSQAIAKWSSRFQLLTSDSVPGVYVVPDTITIIPDIVSASALDPRRPSTSETLTDGCGLMSDDLARRLMLHPSFKHLTSRPCVVQVRIRGAKGLLAIMGPEQEQEYAGMDVVLRDSMVKCPGWTKSTSHDDFSLSTLDVLRVDGLKIGSSLGSEAIIIMQHNGIPVEVLLRMSEQSLENIGKAFAPQPLATESEADARQRLISNVYSLGGVGFERRKREVRQQGLSTRVAGLERSYASDMSSADGTELEEPEVDQGDNKPALMAERLYECLLSGFRPVPQDSALVASNLRSLVVTNCDRAVADFRIQVEQSVTAFIVPDSLGVLAPDEIFVSFGSERPIDPATGRHMHFLEGDCLLYRSPCKLPTDVRKFKAVVRKELFYLRDCIVLSASAFCKASPASFLGGGDYDGDTVTVIWDPTLVAPFRNAPDEIAATPESFERDNFIKEVISAQEVLESLGPADEQTRAINLQHFLLGAILDSPLPGLYSTLHDTAVYERGCGDPQTMRLARMFCHVLDARKSGLQVVPEILKRDRNQYRPVEWREQKKNKGKDSEDQFNKNYAIRPLALPPFIMDLMHDAGKTKRAEVLAAFPDPGKLIIVENTSALQEPYRQLWAQVQRMKPTLSGFVDRHDRLLAAGVASSRSNTSTSQNGYDDDEVVTLRNDVEASLFSGQRALTEDLINHTRTQTEDLFRQVNNLERHVRIVHRLWCHVSTSDDTESVAVLYERLFDNPDAPLSRQTTQSRRVSRKDASVWDHRRKRLIALSAIWRDRLTLEKVPLLVPLGRNDILAELKISCAAYVLSKSDSKRKAERRITNWLFDLDFFTTCALKARTSGQTITVPADMGLRLRPVYRR